MTPRRDKQGNGPFYSFAGWRLYIRRPGCTECRHDYWWGGCWLGRVSLADRAKHPPLRDAGYGEYWNARWPDAHDLMGCETICDAFEWDDRAPHQHGCGVERGVPDHELTLRVDEIPAVLAALKGAKP